MKTSKVSAIFLSKFSAFLSKFKQSSTISVAHQQIRKLFSEYKFSDIAIAFASKMDSCDQLSDKEKKQYIKIYISLIDVYGQDIVLQYYDRIIDSITKKGAGVSEVVGHLCRSLLKRIYPTQNIANYIKHLMISFQRHVEIGKILKQIVESFDSEIVAPFQSEIAGLINEKIQNSKAQLKIQLLQATLALILSLQSKFFEEAIVQSYVSKNFKSDQWNVRKLCVDISYALLVINNEANKILHEGVSQLKYDKIKHVRDSVGNYTNLHKQIYGEEKEKQKIEVGFKSQRQSNLDKRRTITSKSPVISSKFKPNQPQQKSAPKSLQKSIKNASRNQEFFQNAGNRDVIKVSESKSLVFTSNFVPKQQKSKKKPSNQPHSHNLILERDDHEIKQSQSNKKSEEQNQINFEKYLKNRAQTETFLNFSPSEKRENFYLEKQKKNNVKQRTDREEASIQNQYLNNQKEKNESQHIVDSRLIEESVQRSPLSFQIQLKSQLRKINEKFMKFSTDVMLKISNIQARVASLQQVKARSLDISQMSLVSLQKDITQIKNQLTNPKYLQQSFEQRFNDHRQPLKEKMTFAKQQERKSDYALSEKINKVDTAVESNLLEKIQISIRQGNWNEAFSLALANNSKAALIELLKYYQIPKDKLVQDCLFVELRRTLGSWITLKWLTTFFQDNELSKQKLQKLQKDLQSSEYRPEKGENAESGQRNYLMLKSVLVNQIKSKLNKNEYF